MTTEPASPPPDPAHPAPGAQLSLQQAGLALSRDAIFLVRRDATLADVNPAACDILGYTRAELLSMHLSDFAVTYSPATWDSRWDALHQHGALRLEVQQRAKSGRIIPMDLSLSYIVLDGEEYQLAFARDISERKQVEEALRQSEDKFARAFRAAPYAAMLTRRSDGRILEVNDAFTRILGYPYAEAVGQTTLGLGLWDSPEPRQAALERIWQDGRLRDYPVTFRAKNGQSVEGLITAELMQIDGEECIYTSLEDITERKRAEAALRRRNEYLSALQDITLELVAQTELDPLLENIARRAAQLVDTDSCFLDMLDFETGKLVPRVGLGALTESLQYSVAPGEGVAGIVWQTGRPLVINDYDAWEGRIQRYSRGKLFSIAGVPLLAGRSSQVLGVIGLAFSCEVRQTFDAEAVEFLGQFARLATLAIENARLLAAAAQELAGRKDAETRLTAQLDELRRWHALTLGREARILELKREVNELLASAGLPPRYASALEEAA